MQTYQVELVDQTGKISPNELTQVAAALQNQVDRDLAPAWGVNAQVAVRNGTSTPGAWPIKITKSVPSGDLGVHLDTKNGQPYAVILPGSDWSVTASHELLEMLVDPFGSRMMLAPSIDPAANGRMVHYLVEVGDPVETQVYTINGVKVSDFVLESFYREQPQPAGAGYDGQRKVSQPLQVLPGGYISWYDPADRKWHQKTPNGTFVTAMHEAELATDFSNARDSRDKAFGDDPDRHNLQKIRAMLS